MDDREQIRPPEARTPATSSARRPYAPPTLVEYGSVAKLTQSGGNTVVEHGASKKALG
jgi:hypothetical protein